MDNILIQYQVLVGSDSYIFENEVTASRFYEKNMEETGVTCALYKITTEELGIRYAKGEENG